MKHICPNCKASFLIEDKPLNKSDLVLSITDLCAKWYGVTVEEMKGRKRKREMVAARHVAMYFILKYCQWSLNDAGKYFDRDHTTAIHARERCHNAFFTKGDLYADLIPMDGKISELAAEWNRKPLTTLHLDKGVVLTKAA